MKSSVLTMIILLTGLFGYSQGVAIGSESEHSSAMLNVSATLTNGATGAGSQRGILIPRVTFAQRAMISTPATSLLVYQTDENSGFYYNAGTTIAPNWVMLKDDRTNFLSKSASYTITATDIMSSLVIVQTTQTATFTLPAASTVPAGKTIHVISSHPTPNLTLSVSGTIIWPGGSPITGFKAVTLISDGSTTWYVVSYTGQATP
jgi:hypothetical protein